MRFILCVKRLSLRIKNNMSQESLLKIVDSFKDQRVVVIGDVFIDHYIRGVVERLNPEAPVPILHAQEESETTGGAGNTAKNAAGLGATTTLISVVGDDEARHRIEEAATHEGYEAKLIQDASRPTIRKVRYLAGGQQLLRVDYEKVHDISDQVEDQLLALITEVVTPECGAIIVSDYAKGVITARVAETIMSLAATHHIMVGADVKPSRAAFFKDATLISPNLKEAHEYLGLNPLEHHGQQPETLALQLSEKMRATVFLTLGAAGMYIYTKEGKGMHIPQEHVVEVFDVSGAGDTAIAALTLALRAGATPEEAALIGNAAGAVVVGKIGSVAITPVELKNMLMHQHS